MTTPHDIRLMTLSLLCVVFFGYVPSVTTLTTIFLSLSHPPLSPPLSWSHLVYELLSSHLRCCEIYNYVFGPEAKYGYNSLYLFFHFHAIQSYHVGAEEGQEVHILDRCL
jgi:hypothetical protein